VEYDDGDHEWIHLLGESDRVQVQQEDGLWNMVRLLAVICAARCHPGSNASSRLNDMGCVQLVVHHSTVDGLLSVLTTVVVSVSLCLLQYTMYQSEELQNETRKREARRQKETYQQQAFRDANQWRSFLDDVTKEVMFLSNITGTRCGSILSCPVN
jgi:mannitol-specific phosphotransferase system IIBC component